MNTHAVSFLSENPDDANVMKSRKATQGRSKYFIVTLPVSRTVSEIFIITRTVLAVSIIMSIRNCVHLLIFLIFVSLMVVCALEIWINALCLIIFLAVYLLVMTAPPLNCALESIPHSSTWTQ